MKKRYLLAGMFVLVLAVALFAVACGGGTTTTTAASTETTAASTETTAAQTETTAAQTGTTAAATGEPIKIGFLGDFTGDEAQTGLNQKASMKLAFDAIGNQIGNRPVQIIYEDDADSPATAVDKARKLVEQDKVVAIFGPNEAGEKMSVADYIKTSGHVPLILFSPAPMPLLQADNPWLVATCGSNTTIPSPMGDYVYNTLGYKKVDTIGEEGAAGQAFIGGFMSTFKALGGTAVDQVYPPTATQDFGPVLATLHPADALVVWMPPGIPLMVAYNKSGMKMPLVGAFHGATFDPWVYGALAKTNPDVAKAVAGIPCPMEYAPDSQSQANQTFVAAAKAAWGENIVLDGSNVNPYNTAQLFIKVMQANGGDTTPDKLVQALLSTPWEGPQGPASFAAGSHCATINVYIVKEVAGSATDQYPYHYETVKTYEAVPPTGLAVQK